MLCLVMLLIDGSDCAPRIYDIEPILVTNDQCKNCYDGDDLCRELAEAPTAINVCNEKFDTCRKTFCKE